MLIGVSIGSAESGVDRVLIRCVIDLVDGYADGDDDDDDVIGVLGAVEVERMFIRKCYRPG